MRAAGKYRKIVFFIIPAIFLLLAIQIHYWKGILYIDYVDPEYLHLFNGLNLAIFNLAVDYIFHPGTLIQYYYAISAHIVNLTQEGSGLIDNALKDPESFIHGANLLMNLVNSGILCMTGILVYRYTSNYFYAIILQLAPLSDHSFLMISGRLIPEAALIGPLLLLFVLIIKYINDSNPERNKKFYLVTFAIVGGLGIASKYLYVPFLLIPFFFFPRRSWWLKYFLFTTAAVMIIAFPRVCQPQEIIQLVGQYVSAQWKMGRWRGECLQCG